MDSSGTCGMFCGISLEAFGTYRMSWGISLEAFGLFGAIFRRVESGSRLFIGFSRNITGCVFAHYSRIFQDTFSLAVVLFFPC